MLERPRNIDGSDYGSESEPPIREESMSEERPWGLWPELRSWPLPVQIGAGALALAMIGTSFALPELVGHGDVDESDWPDGELPAAEGAIAAEAESGGSPGSDESAPDGVEPYGGDPLWSTELGTDGGTVVHLDQGALFLTDEGLRLEDGGERVWEHPVEEFGPEVGVADEVVVVSVSIDSLFEDEDYEWPGREDTVALDLETGEEVWRDQDASFVSVYSDAVLMTECTGEQAGNIGDCTLYARDPQNLATLWSTPTYASAQAVGGGTWTGEPLPDPLLIESYPNGHEDRTVTAYEDGNALASVQTHDGSFVAGDTLVFYDDYDDNPADECTATLTGYGLRGGERLWQIEAETAKTEDLVSCGGLATVRPRDGMLPLTIGGEAALVDLATGETAWTAPEAGRAVGLGPGADVLAVAVEGETDNLVAYDVESGDELWTATASIGASTRTSAVGSTLWVHGSASMWGWSDYGVVAYNLETGEGLALPGSAKEFRPGQVVTVLDDIDRTTLSAWPADLWG